MIQNDDTISRQAVIAEIEERKNANGYRNVAVISELNRLEGYIMRLPSVQSEKRTETHACDLIDRRALMKEFADFVRASNNSDYARTPTWNDAVSLVGSMPSAQQDCTECEDYDSERHSCPKYCDVIRRTLEEAKQKRTGRWINNHCSECGAVCRDIRDKWCYGCGARMEEPEDIPMEYFESGER